MDRAVRGAAGRAGKAAAGGEVDLDIEPVRLGVEVAAAHRPGRGQAQRLLQQRCVTHGWSSAPGPVLVQPGAVLATVKDATRRASSRGGLRPSLTAAARGRPGGRQAGTKKRPLAAEPRNARRWVASVGQARARRDWPSRTARSHICCHCTEESRMIDYTSPYERGITETSTGVRRQPSGTNSYKATTETCDYCSLLKKTITASLFPESSWLVIQPTKRRGVF